MKAQQVEALKVCRILLIELLAHQFAMPVQWIATQDLIFREGSKTLIEMGPAPTLSTMAKRTFQMGIYGDVVPDILWWGNDYDTIFMNAVESKGQSLDEFFSPPKVEEIKEAPQVSPERPVVQSLPVQASGNIPDVPISAKLSLIAILVSKLKLKVSEIKDSSTIKALSQGRSAIQNEIVGDVSSEFSGSSFAGLSIAELPLSEIVSSISDYKQFGKITSAILSRTLPSKLPGGFPVSAVREYLKSRGFTPSTTEGILLFASLTAPASRLSLDSEAKEWIEQAIKDFGAFSNVDLTPAVISSSAPVNAVFDSAALSAHEKKLRVLFSEQRDALTNFIGDAKSNSVASTSASDLALESIRAELGDEFIDGINSVYDSRKVRQYDSYWNWVIQDAFELHLHIFASVRRHRGEDVIIPNQDNDHFNEWSRWVLSIISGTNNIASPSVWFRNFLCNRASKELLESVRFFAKCMEHEEPDYAQVIAMLAYQIEQWVDRVPVVVIRAVHDAPRTEIASNGRIEYKQVPRIGTENCVEYVREIASGCYYAKEDTHNVSHPSQSIVLGGMDISMTKTFSSSDLTRVEDIQPSERKVSLKSEEVLDKRKQSVSSASDSVPLVHLKSMEDGVRKYDVKNTSAYLSCLHAMAARGVSFAGQVALVTGGGVGSIAIEIVKLLLEGGATVISALNYNKSEESIQSTLKTYQALYDKHGSKGAKLITEPWNAGSSQDVAALISHIYNDLHLDLDFIIPFAAIPEMGRDISNIDSRSELAHRAMLTNVIRLLGHVREAKRVRGVFTRPAMVLLPCSPNHGVFGGDGLYAESKLALESLMNKWASENWSDFISLSACVIGWTRSQLMFLNNIVAQGVEELGCRTFFY